MKKGRSQQSSHARASRIVTQTSDQAASSSGCLAPASLRLAAFVFLATVAAAAAEAAAAQAVID